jgi:hypothetical protein
MKRDVTKTIFEYLNECWSLTNKTINRQTGANVANFVFVVNKIHGKALRIAINNAE